MLKKYTLKHISLSLFFLWQIRVFLKLSVHLCSEWWKLMKTHVFISACRGGLSGYIYQGKAGNRPSTGCDRNKCLGCWGCCQLALYSNGKSLMTNLGQSCLPDGTANWSAFGHLRFSSNLQQRVTRASGATGFFHGPRLPACITQQSRATVSEEEAVTSTGGTLDHSPNNPDMIFIHLVQFWSATFLNVTKK